MVAIALLLAAGCSSHVTAEAPAPIASFLQLRLGIHGRDSSFDVTLDDHRSELEPCAVLAAAAAAQLGAIDVPLVERGAKVFDADDANECALPRFGAVLAPPDRAAVLEIRDRSGAIRCALPGLRAVRQDATVPTGPWAVQAGQSITVAWPPARADQTLVQLFAMGGSGSSTLLEPEVLGDGAMRFTIPVLDPGVYDLALARSPAPASCDPAPGSTPGLVVEHSFHQSVTIVPSPPFP